MSSLNDPVKDGLQRGWKVLGGAWGAVPEKIVCDVATIIVSGAGAGITAELLAKAGLSVVITEERPLKSSSDFNPLAFKACPALYQESAVRKTADKAINILQGRCVGGSTMVNWTSSFRTPASTLNSWQIRLGLAGSARQGVTRPDGAHWQLDNLSVHGGSIFPTSIGANPQLSVYGAVSRLAQGLAKTLTGRGVALA